MQPSPRRSARSSLVLLRPGGARLLTAVRACRTPSEQTRRDRLDDHSADRRDRCARTSRRSTPRAEVLVSGVGSSAGIEAVSAGTADIGTSSRDLKDEERTWVSSTPRSPTTASP